MAIAPSKTFLFMNAAMTSAFEQLVFIDWSVDLFLFWEIKYDLNCLGGFLVHWILMFNLEFFGDRVTTPGKLHLVLQVSQTLVRDLLCKSFFT